MSRVQLECVHPVVLFSLISWTQGRGCVWTFTTGQAQGSDPLKTRQQLDLERAHFLVTQAFEEDEKGNDEEAVELYTQAVELCIQTVRLSGQWSVGQ